MCFFVSPHTPKTLFLTTKKKEFFFGYPRGGFAKIVFMADIGVGISIVNPPYETGSNKNKNKNHLFLLVVKQKALFVFVITERYFGLFYLLFVYGVKKNQQVLFVGFSVMVYVGYLLPLGHSLDLFVF